MKYEWDTSTAVFVVLTPSMLIRCLHHLLKTSPSLIFEFAVCLYIFFFKKGGKKKKKHKKQGQVYYVFGFLSMVAVVVMTSVCLTTIVYIYYQLIFENHHWWWRSMFTSSGMGFYYFLYCVYYYTNILKVRSWTGMIVYFSFTLVSTLSMSIIVGTVGFFSAWLFIRKIYSSIKIE